MYARQYQPIGLHGIFDALKEVVTGGAGKYFQLKQEKVEQKRRQQELELAYARQAAEQASSERMSMQMMVQQASQSSMTMPIILGIGGLGLYFYMRR